MTLCQRIQYALPWIGAGFSVALIVAVLIAGFYRIEHGWLPPSYGVPA